MLAAASASWLRYPLAVLLVLLGMNAAVAPRVGDEIAADVVAGVGISGRQLPLVTGEQAPAAHVTKGDPNRGLRLSALARQAPTTTLPDNGASCPDTTGTITQHGWSPAGGFDRTDTVGTAPTTCLSRAPPSTSDGLS